MRISQFVISFGEDKVGGIKFAKNVNAFTEQGLAMLSGVLNSRRAIQVNLAIMRTFVKLRQVISNNKEVMTQFKELKLKVDKHDTEIGLIIRAIEKMLAYEAKPKNKIGFLNN